MHLSYLIIQLLKYEPAFRSLLSEQSLDVEAGRRGSEYWERDLMTNEQPLENVLLLSLLPDVVITL